MKGLSSLERIILECLGTKKMNYDEIQIQTGLQENVCFNIIQALIIRGVIRSEDGFYRISKTLSPLMMEEMNGKAAQKSEVLELMEATLDQEEEKSVRLLKVAMDARDEKIFFAMLSNLESFLKDAHSKAQSSTPLKNRKVVFWGVAEVMPLARKIIEGK